MNLKPFVFYTERRLVGLTGVNARNLGELVQGLRDLPGSTIFFHTHQMYLAHHFETPTVTNDFALWASVALKEHTLAEKLTAIDLLSFTSIRQLRKAIIKTIEDEIREEERALWACREGEEFHFCKSKSFIMPTRLMASDPKRFFEVLPRVSNESIFFHFFEARLRMGRHGNDFSQWLEQAGELQLADAIEKLNPYDVTLDEFKDQIVALGRGRGA